MSSHLRDEALVHARRIFQWRLNLVEPTERERERLDGAFKNKETGQEIKASGDEADDHRVLRALLAWRHTNLLVALPIVLFGSVWDVVLMFQNMSGDDAAYYNGLGNFVLRLPYLAPIFLLGGTGLGLLRWHEWRPSRNVVRAGWGLSFVLPFVPALFPVESLLTRDAVRAFQRDEAAQAQLAALKVFLALAYLFSVLPLVITFPGGAVRAAIRTRGLLPESSLAGRILVVSAPFYSLLILTSLVVIIQLLGSWVLVVGAVVLALNPWIHVVFRNLYLSPPSYSSQAERDAQEGRLDAVQRVAALSSVAGYALVLAWAVAEGVVGEAVTAGQLVNFFLRGFGNGLVTAVVFCDALVRMSASHWRADRDRRRAADGGAGIDAALSRLEAAVRRPGGGGGPPPTGEKRDGAVKTEEFPPGDYEETDCVSPATLNAAIMEVAGDRAGNSAVVATAPRRTLDEENGSL